MNFCFGLQDLKWNIYRDESIFNVKYTHKEMSYQKDENGERRIVYKYTDLKAKPCKKEDFGIVVDYFHNLAWLE